MCCAKLGDRLYFLGGMLNITRDHLPQLNLGHFPPTVCSFDPSTGEVKDPALPPMNSGKNWPLSFVADDNLYVLGSCILRLVHTASPTYFEVFEPRRDRWTPLDPPPRVGYWDSCSIVGRKVLVLGHYAELLCFAFDLDTRKWAKIFEPRREVENLPLWTSSHVNEEGSSEENAAAALYGVGSHGKLFINEGHTEVHELLNSHSWNQISLVQDGRRGVGVDPFFPKGYPHLASSLCYLGDGCFFYLAMGSPFLNRDADKSKEDDQDHQFILTVIFKDNILDRDHDEAQPSSASQAFQVECIHFAHEFNLSLKNIWRIENSFAFHLTPKQISTLIARAPEAAGATGSLKNIATCGKGLLEIMSSNLSNQECEVQKECEQKIKQETWEEMEAQFRKRVANVQPDIRVRIAKELAQQLLDKFADLT
ncbi:hypothetical protein Tsubulata_032525 [Turnera subulata]|uniref:Uncharacterized protein n=1 Tax=Turnera subulata TaxID=218843 RepID=A0A9Q0JE25_9ROSI|nr:hypothetical protein Tsubulata_032525 [Turnera subulata]